LKHKQWTAFGAMLVVVVALVIGLALELNSSVPRQGSASTVGSNGLRLSASIDATEIKVGQTLQVNVSLFNTLSEVNTVATSDDWSFQGVPVALWPPCFYSNSTTPVQAVVLMGNYTLADISTVANVHFPLTCMEDWNIDHATFQPESSQANVTGIYNVNKSNDTLGPFQLSTSFTTTGYWNLLSNSRQLNPPILGADQDPPLPPTVTAFVPGTYTVAVADEWRQAVILHFVVNA
jgi:hypothetical protein